MTSFAGVQSRCCMCMEFRVSS
ncbi:TPA: hypothetical protein N0F65_007996 [Lagenidium giganteum]|uniref:Uncharacterized protein n=1 Tax=Lagenidium giganteum TaxID=4803 RepID=A0AAV2YQ53_9STRA|nr:TPA: hypothetical protein N0F65_007996 [Lagenidium giganteum]